MIGRLGQRLMKSERWRQWYEKGLEASQARAEQARARLAQAFADAPRDVSWTFDVDRSELRDSAGELVLRMKPGLPIESPSGEKLARIGAGGLALVPALAHNPLGNDPDQEWLVDEGGLVVAKASIGTGEQRWFCATVDLLPPVRLNDALAERQLADEVRDRVAALTPLEYRLVSNSTGELRGADGRLLARDHFAHSMAASAASYTAVLDSWSIEVNDNPLPAAWLLGVLRCTEILRGVQLRDRRPDVEG